MKKIEAGIDIHAEPEEVFRVLTDFASYTDWNDVFVRMEGEAREGSTFWATIRDPDSRKENRVSAKVTRVERPSYLEWAGGLPIPGLFAARHYFEIEPNGAGGTRFHQTEEFRGLLTMLVGTKILDKGTRSFRRFNELLKARTEAPR